jgi:hypothetical protein
MGGTDDRDSRQKKKKTNNRKKGRIYQTVSGRKERKKEHEADAECFGGKRKKAA